MLVKFIGDSEDIGIPWGTEFSVTMSEIEDADRKYSFKITLENREISVSIFDTIAVGAETAEDVEYLQYLMADILSHKNVLLGNVDCCVFDIQDAEDDLGRWLYENEWWDSHNVNRYKCGRVFWHYLVSEMVKDEGLPYYEARPVLPGGGRFTRFELVRVEDGAESVLATFPSVTYNNDFHTTVYELLREE